MPLIDWTDPNRPTPKKPPAPPPLGRDAELVRRVRQMLDDLKEFEAERSGVAEGDWLLTPNRIRRYRRELARQLRVYRLVRRQLIERLRSDEDFCAHLASGNL